MREATYSSAACTDPPADPEQRRNWLPTPANDHFQLAARFYGPTPGLLDGTYPMPKAIRTDGQ
ncbi:DUF1214 domain-containing protein [Nocardia sp. NEAU-G5]|uniref:DUF1214 domain-containing protein n=1 Tax=Nocardia albiluteola TaxID=2842303 RepID=A0ABS6BAH7_9NOCA|nr:DUF1214 domain-containing protein [Nocardia albiluteola]MBU3067302.1 DUF1214 domain-containing protein [Nocardia albiluteola]